MAKLKFVFIASMALLILSGCGDQKIIEDIGFVHTTSYDLLPNGLLKIALSIPKADPESDINREVLVTEARSSKEGRIKLSQQTQLVLMSGQLRNTLFGNSIARNGVWDHIDTLTRDPAISPQMKITVVDGDAEKLLSKDYKQHPRTGRYIDQLLAKESQNQIVPKTTLHDFAKDYYDDGIDPVAPVVQDIGNNVKVSGIGLFQDDKLITKIPAKDALIFALLRGKFRKGEISVDLGDSGEKMQTAMFSSMVSKRKISVLHVDQSYYVTIKVKVQGSILEYIGNLKISEHSGRHQLEQQISRSLNERMEEMVRFMQENHVDSLGLGKYVRNSMSYKAWKSMKWSEEYPRVKVTTILNIKIKDIGKGK